MTPVVRRSVLAVVGLFAIFGALMALGFVRVGWSACEHFVLSRAVSPNGSLVAEHVREDCGAKGVIHSLSIGPARSGDGARYSGYLLFEGDRHAEGDALIKPAVLWWDSEDRLSVIYPRGTAFLDQTELFGVTVRAATRGELE